MNNGAKFQITNVFLRMHDLKRISDIARVELLDYDRQEQYRFELPRLPFGRVKNTTRVVMFHTRSQSFVNPV